MKEQIILGIDPGTRITGYAVAKREGRKTYLLEYNYLNLETHEHLPARIALFHDILKEKLSLYQATHIALETPFLGKNAQTFLKLGYLRGIAYLLAHQHSCTLHEVAPREVKIALTGYGNASKDQVALMVRRMLSTQPTAKLKHDVTDAIAVALCGLWKTEQATSFRQVLG